MKINKNPVQYYVEGETEKVFIEQIKYKYVLNINDDLMLLILSQKSRENIVNKRILEVLNL